jgi:hypothetical protein
VGYGLDPFVSDQQLRTALAAGQADWRQSNYGAGILKFVQHMHHTLKLAHRIAMTAAKKGALPAGAGMPRSAPQQAKPRARHPES